MIPKKSQTLEHDAEKRIAVVRAIDHCAKLTAMAGAMDRPRIGSSAS
jgi:hypothetical protein